MATVTKVKATSYIDHRDAAIKDRGVFIAKKNRPQDIHGVYKATTGYKIELNKDDAKDIKKTMACQYRTSTYSTEEIVKYCVDKGYLPNKKRLYLYNGDFIWNFLDEHGFRKDDKTAGPLRQPTGELIVFCIDDYVQCEQTKQEKEILAKLEDRSKMQGLNTLMVQDNIVKTLNAKKYNVHVLKANQEHTAIFFENKRSFNALIKDAVEYYLNNIVLKDLGCKITMPKQKPTHGYKYDDALCYVGDIELDKGE